MSKNNNKEVSAAVKLAALQAEMAKLQEKVAAEEKQKTDALAVKINALPKQLGLANLDDVINVIKKVQKGVLGKVDNSARAYVRLTDEQRKTIKTRLASGEQVSVIADSMGIQYGTVYAIKKGKDSATETPATEAAIPAVETPAPEQVAAS